MEKTTGKCYIYILIEYRKIWGKAWGKVKETTGKKVTSRAPLSRAKNSKFVNYSWNTRYWYDDAVPITLIPSFFNDVIIMKTSTL